MKLTIIRFDDLVKKHAHSSKRTKIHKILIIMKMILHYLYFTLPQVYVMIFQLQYFAYIPRLHHHSKLSNKSSSIGSSYYFSSF